jgi:hypothetical protein
LNKQAQHTKAMKTTIADSKTLQEIQNEFNHQFPFLRLEFVSKKSKPGPDFRDKKNPNSALSAYRKAGKEDIISFEESMTVQQLETQFMQRYGLNAQVFRRSGKLWLETTATDNWTLGYQNEQGQELSNSDLNTEKEESDYHEQE